jgi:hypothetical protein
LVYSVDKAILKLLLDLSSGGCASRKFQGVDEDSFLFHPDAPSFTHLALAKLCLALYHSGISNRRKETEVLIGFHLSSLC